MISSKGERRLQNLGGEIVHRWMVFHESDWLMVSSILSQQLIGRKECFLTTEMSVI